MVRHSSALETESRRSPFALTRRMLMKLLKRDSRLHHVGIYRSDEWNPNVRGGSIVNTAKRGERGRHWVAFWVTETEIFFFDSAGNHPRHYGFDLSGYRFRYNGTRWQSRGTPYCGYYCLFFLWHRARGIVHSKLRVKYRSSNLRRNDYLVYRGCVRLASS